MGKIGIYREYLTMEKNNNIKKIAQVTIWTK